MAKIGRNDICPLCSSGKKYKHCHLMMQEKEQAKHKNEPSWFERVSNAPFFVRISSSDGQPAGMTISSASITKNGVKTILLDEELTVSVGSVNGEKTQESLALLSIPQHEAMLGEIRTSGNACISNNSEHHSICIAATCIKKIRSNGGLFANVRIKKQNEPSFDHFDILCGPKGKKEHSHITFYPEGNGKFIGFREENCRLETKLCYDNADKNIFPSEAIIHFNDYSETLTLTFDFNNIAKLVTLNDAAFSGQEHQA